MLFFTKFLSQRTTALNVGCGAVDAFLYLSSNGGESSGWLAASATDSLTNLDSVWVVAGDVTQSLFTKRSRIS